MPASIYQNKPYLIFIAEIYQGILRKNHQRMMINQNIFKIATKVVVA